MSPLRAGVAASFLMLAVLATGGAAFGVQQFKTKENLLDFTLQQGTDLINIAVAQAEQFNVSRSRTAAALQQAERLIAKVARTRITSIYKSLGNWAVRATVRIGE